MNVLYLTMNPNRQSTTVPTEGWFRFLPERGLRPVLVSRELGAFHEWSLEQGIPAYQDALPFPSKRNPIPFFRSLWHLRKIVQKHRIELIHCNEQDIYPIGQYLGRICKLPVVVSVHFTMGRGYCTWAFGGKKAPERMFFVSRRNLEACRDGLDGVVPESQWQVLHNGLDLTSYRPDAVLAQQFRQEHSLEPDDILIGAGCAFRERKQLEHLFEVGSRLANDRVKLVLAGFPVSEEAAYAESLLSEAKQLLGGRLQFVGCLSDMRGFSNALDLFVNTSREESFGISVLEGLACGCPTVGYDSKAVDEVVLPDGGEIVEQDNVDKLTDAVRHWTQNRQWLKEQRPLARKQAERFDLQKLSYQLWDEYNDVLSIRNPKSVKAAATV